MISNLPIGLLPAACLALHGLPLGMAAEPASSQPNIIFILADDLGYGEIGPYGQAHIRTPALDQLARNGMRFTDHYAGSTVCAPSRSALMTGLHTGHTWVRNNFGQDPETGKAIRIDLRDEDVTVAEVLRKAGYRTGVIGKWGLGEPDSEGTPLKQGFDRFFGFLNQARAHNHYPTWIWDQDQPYPLPGNENGQEQTYIHDLFTREAMAFVESARTDPRPFFLYLAYTLPHADLKVPDDQPRAGDDPNAIFTAMVERLDRDIGRLQTQLEEMGLSGNTVLIFTSDNGAHQQDGKDNDFFKASGPFRGHKRDIREGGIRVPLIVQWPGKIVPGSTSGHVSAFWDFLPTAAELAGVAAPEGLDGISYLPALLGLPNRAHPHLYWEFVHKEQTRQAVRCGDWKLIRLNPGNKITLTHLPSDPAERTDLQQTYPAVRDRLLTIMNEARRPHPFYPLSID